MVNYDGPESLNFIAFSLAGGTIPAYKVFMLRCLLVYLSRCIMCWHEHASE